MPNVTSIFGTTGTPIVQAPVLPTAPTAAVASTASVGASQNQNVVVPSRLFADPLSGTVITQLLDNRGKIVSQFPTTAVVAYLQQGLTPEGFPVKATKTTTA